ISEALWWLDRKDEAKRFYREAEELKKRFNEAFWMEEEESIALGLDPQKRQIRSAASNPGHCIATEIVDQSLVTRTADRLMRNDLLSGCGMWATSSEDPAFNH